uniref:RRM domain-containing protein n=1 Tax=Fagus sylvatica TaxID=28930 RepID=A0A2N9FH15_FAGSY
MAIVVGKDVATGSYAFSWGDETSHNPVVELDGESNSAVKEKITDSSSLHSKGMSHRKRSCDAKEESNYSEVASQLKKIAITFKNQGPVDANELYEAVMSTEGFAEEVLLKRCFSFRLYDSRREDFNSSSSSSDTTWQVQVSIHTTSSGPLKPLLLPLLLLLPSPVTAPPPPIMVDNSGVRPPNDEVRTIFITGLPEDVKERELQNLLRWLPGYEASQVNFKGEKPMGFALFSAAHLALAAKDALQDMVFDAESKSVLHTEMAKKNLFVKRGIVADSSPYDQSKRLRTGGDYTHTGYTSPSPFHPPPPPHVWGPHGYMAPPPPPPPYDPYGGYPVPPVPMPAPTPVPAPSNFVPVQILDKLLWVLLMLSDIS